MVKKRIHELAKELNIESKEIINNLKNMGINVKSHMSTLEENEIELFLKRYNIKSDRLNVREVKEPEEKPAGVPVLGEQKDVEKSQVRAAAAISKDEGENVQARQKIIQKSEKQEVKKDVQDNKAEQYRDRGPGLVDRVPSRPPDRRFHERIKSQDRPEKTGIHHKSEQVHKPKAAEEIKEKTRHERQVQDQAGQLKAQKEHLPKEKAHVEAGHDESEKFVRQEKRPYGKPKDKKVEHEKVPAKPGGKKAEDMGPTKAAGAPRQAKLSERSQVQTHQAARIKPSGGVQTRPRQDIPVVWPPVRLDEKGRPTQEKQKPVDKQKQAKFGGPKAADKVRPDKRSILAEEAEEKLWAKSFGPARKKQADKGKEPVQTAERKPIVISGSITVQELALKMHKSPAELIKKLLQLGVLATINQEIDTDTATILASEFGYDVEVKLPVDMEAVIMQEPQDDPALLQPRPCVVTVMGHVDHGKTSLLDAIRQTNVTATEAGGITQHIGAYQIEHNGKKITFLDTPGHEAFTAMRARGAKVTDIAILVVAADDGVMPQTIEAINHAKDAGVPIIVAINKIDKPGANPERVKQQLTEYGLIPEEWGGDTICVNVSALKKQGLEDLMEMILLVAEVSELKANPNRPARGTVIEAELDKGRGPVATVLVQNGTLNVGDYIVAGVAYGRVRAMMDDKGRRIKKAGPSTPVEVLGLSEVPCAGDIFVVVEDEKLAKTIAARRQARKREEELKATGRVSLEDLFKQIREGQIKELGVIIKADAQGSVEALRQALERLSTEEVKVNIIHGGVGAITETDIMLASASNAIIIGFNVRPDVNARKANEKEKVDIRLYRVIYDAIDDVKAAMSGLLEPEYREVMLGRAEIRKIFKASRIGTIAGCYVLEGKVERDASIRVVRDGIVIHEGKIESLKRFKDDVKEVPQGYECGMALEKFNDIQEGDIIEAFTMEAIKREL